MFAWESTVPALARLPQDWTRHRLEGINPGVLLPPPKSLHRCSQERNRGTGRPSNGQPWERFSSCVISSETWSHCPNAAESIRVNCTGPIFRRPQCGLFIAMLTFICRGSARRRTSASLTCRRYRCRSRARLIPALAPGEVEPQCLSLRARRRDRECVGTLR